MWRSYKVVIVGVERVGRGFCVCYILLSVVYILGFLLIIILWRRISIVFILLGEKLRLIVKSIKVIWLVRVETRMRIWVELLLCCKYCVILIVKAEV